jgi:hypothetical protein
MLGRRLDLHIGKDVVDTTLGTTTDFRMFAVCDVI